MSRALNLASNNLQGYGPSESSCLPCLGVSGRAVNLPSCPPRIKYKTLRLKTLSSKCSSRHTTSFHCKASSGGQRRNPDFSRQNRFSRNRNRQNEERESSEHLDESEFLSTKNGPLLSLSNTSPKSQPTATPGPREREIVELFKKVQAQLRERSAVKEEKKFEAQKGQSKESETVDSLLKLLRKHSVEQGKRKVVNGEEKNNRSFFNSSSMVVKEEPKELDRPSFSRPPSNFRKKSPVPRVRYEPIVSDEDTFGSVSHSDFDEKTDETRSEPDPEPELESDLDPDMDLISGLELEPEEDQEPELEPEADSADGHIAGELLEDELSDDDDDEEEEEEEESHVEEDAGKEEKHTEVKDLNAMKLAELRAVAKARGMKGFSKLKKAELIGLLSEEDSILS